MSKIELQETNSGFNLQKINDNFQKIEAELNDKVLYRDVPEDEPNEMLNDLDMNGNRIYNLPAPTLESEAARLKDVQDAISGATSAALISFEPYGDISSSNVQGAIQEVYDEVASDSLRDDLASTDVGKGASLVAYNTNQNVKQALDARAEIVECVHDLVGKIGKEGQVVQTQAYWPGWAATLGGIPVGGAAYIWDSSLERTKHNGGCFISPTVPWDGAENTFADFIAGTGESSPSSNGCWVHLKQSSDSGYNVLQWGAKNDATSNGANDAFIQPMLDYLEQSISGGRGSRVFFPRGAYRFTSSFHIRDRQALIGEGTDGTVIQFVGAVNDHCIYMGPTGPNHPLNPNGHHVFATRCERMSISGNNTYQGFDRAMVYTDGAHEHSGLFQCVVRDFVSIGVYYNTGNGGPAFFEINSAEIYGSDSAPSVGNKCGIKCSAGGSIVKVTHATITGGPNVKLAAGILMEKDNLLLEGGHFENAGVGISLAQDDSDSPRGNTLINVTGNSSVTRLLSIGSLFQGSVSAFGITNTSVSTSGLIVIDNIRTHEQFIDTSVASYIYPKAATGMSSTTARVNVSGGVASVPRHTGEPFTAERTAIGKVRITFAHAISGGADYTVHCNARPSAGGPMFCTFNPVSSSVFDITTFNQAGAATDPQSIWFTVNE